LIDGLPVRGPAVRSLGLRLPPARMPLLRRGRPLKRWRWVGVFGPELMLCVGDARVAGIPQRWWAVAEPDGSLHEGAGAAPAELELGDGEAVEVASQHGSSYIWTRKRAGLPVRGAVTLGGRRLELGGEAFVDQTAGYHARHTTWHWSAGSGRLADGRRVAWNLVDGVHDAPEASERTVWVEGSPHEVGPVEFAADLSAVGGLRFSAWCAREDHTRRGPFRSDYLQPFGTFAGELPGGLELAEGYGVMEWHDALW
jgi:Protein of unknown function (DUF2804)